jgi:DHA1 family bicyclomycin/chloramphenicol resistance-like MFS transporter
MSRALSGLGVIAIAAPLLGGAVAYGLGWRATMGLLGALASALLLFVYLRVPETAPPAQPHTQRLGPLVRQLGATLAHPAFQAWSMLVACTYGGLFIYLSSSGFVLMDMLGLPAWQAGLALATTSASYIAGTFWCRRLLPRHGLAGSVMRAAVPTLAGGLLLAALAWTGVQTLWAVLLPLMIYTFGHGVHQPCGQAGAVAHFPHAAGTASALAGFILALVAFGIGQWLGLAMDGSTRPVALGVAFWSVLTAVVAWTAVRRHGEPPRAAA